MVAEAHSADPFTLLTEEERAFLAPAAAPTHAHAMKAVLTDQRFSDPDWIFERKARRDPLRGDP